MAFILGILLAEYGSRQMFLAASMFLTAVFFPLIRKQNYRECVLRGALLLAVGALGAGGYVRQVGIWEKEKQEIFSGQNLHIS